MKHKTIQKFSPLALGIMVLSYPIIQGSVAYGASLKSAAVDSQLLKPGVPVLKATSVGSAAGCSLSPAGSGLGLPSVTGSATPASNVVASSVTGSVVPATAVANAPDFDNAAPSGVQENSSGNLVAQASLDDCCEIGGTTTCEVGGLPPAGGGILGGGGPSPLLALLGVPAALIPAFLGGSDSSSNNPTPTPMPVPESSSTGAIAAGFGLIGLWYGRRLRNVRKTYS
jgi:hypothetical protein